MYISHLVRTARFWTILWYHSGKGFVCSKLLRNRDSGVYEPMRKLNNIIFL